MSMSKRKPKYNADTQIQELLTVVCAYYGAPVDDRKRVDEEHMSLRGVAEYFGITVMKARKLLITGNVYSTTLSRRVQDLYNQGMTTAEIMKITGLKRSSVNSYIPYSHIVYNMPEISIEAERQKQYRVRKRNKRRSKEEIEMNLWKEFIYLQGCLFDACGGRSFTYQIIGVEMVVSQEELRIPRTEVLEIYRRSVKTDEDDMIITIPKRSSFDYLYPVLMKMGAIKRETK